MHWAGVLVVLCALLGSIATQEETHLPEYLVFTKQFTVNVQIREPSGIMIWTRNSPLIEAFGIEFHVGRNNNSHHTPEWKHKLEAKTYSVIDGKFMITDPNLVVERGELIRYRFSILHKGTVHYSNYRVRKVTDHLFYRPKSSFCESQCLISDQRALHEETRRLQTVLENKILDCVGFQASEHLFFPFENATSYISDPQWFVKYRLWQIDALRSMVDNVVTTYLAPNGVGVKMKTIIDKLKVLELGRERLNVVDFDSLLQDTIGSKVEIDEESTTETSN